jgi:hypothetical protein
MAVAADPTPPATSDHDGLPSRTDAAQPFVGCHAGQAERRRVVDIDPAGRRATASSSTVTDSEPARLPRADAAQSLHHLFISYDRGYVEP